jgi:hypothetical protein
LTRIVCKKKFGGSEEKEKYYVCVIRHESYFRSSVLTRIFRFMIDTNIVCKNNVWRCSRKRRQHALV